METWSRAASRELLEEARTRHALGADTLAERGAAPERVRTAYRAARDARVLAELAEVPVDRIREVSTGRVRVGLVEAAGFRTVAQVLLADAEELDAIAGVGPKTARLLREAAQQIFDAVDDALTFRIEADPADPLATDLVRALHTHEQVARFFDAWGERLDVDVPQLARLAEVGALRGTLVKRFFAGRERTAAADSALTALRETVDGLDDSGVTDALRRLDRTLTGTSDAEVWRDYEARAAAYYTALGELVDLGVDVEAAEGYLPEDVVDRVSAQDLDTSLLTVSLRGYQAFGARYALVQRRTILGDEMGLGKTVQAIAVMAHLAARGRRHFLVICPASVVGELDPRGRRSTPSWRSGCCTATTGTQASAAGSPTAASAITTFPQLGRLAPPGCPRPALLVVDEAHYVKNPAAAALGADGGLGRRAPSACCSCRARPWRTPVDEFRSLVRLPPARRRRPLDPAAGLAGRRGVPPVGRARCTCGATRRTCSPSCPSWSRWTSGSGSASTTAPPTGGAVLKRSFMAMRRAAFVQAPEPSRRSSCGCARSSPRRWTTTARSSSSPSSATCSRRCWTSWAPLAVGPHHRLGARPTAAGAGRRVHRTRRSRRCW